MMGSISDHHKKLTPYSVPRRPDSQQRPLPLSHAQQIERLISVVLRVQTSLYDNTPTPVAHTFGCTMEKIAQFWDSVPRGAQWALASFGALFAAKKTLAFLSMILNIFVLSGTNVSSILLLAFSPWC